MEKNDLDLIGLEKIMITNLCNVRWDLIIGDIAIELICYIDSYYLLKFLLLRLEASISLCLMYFYEVVRSVEKCHLVSLLFKSKCAFFTPGTSFYKL